MRLSNKILIGFFSSILLYTFLGFAEMRFGGTHRDKAGDFTEKETVPLDTVRHLIIKDLDHRLYVKGSKYPRIEIRSNQGDLLKNLAYSQEGDTLSVTGFQDSTDVDYVLELHLTPGEIETTYLSDSYLQIDNIELDSTSIEQSGGWIWLGSQCHIKNIVLEARNDGRFEVSNSEINNISISADSADIRILSKIGRLEGSFSNSSSLILSDVDEVAFKKDQSSRIRILQ